MAREATIRRFRAVMAAAKGPINVAIREIAAPFVDPKLPDHNKEACFGDPGDGYLLMIGGFTQEQAEAMVQDINWIRVISITRQWFDRITNGELAVYVPEGEPTASKGDMDAPIYQWFGQEALEALIQRISTTPALADQPLVRIWGEVDISVAQAFAGTVHHGAEGVPPHWEVETSTGKIRLMFIDEQDQILQL